MARKPVLDLNAIFDEVASDVRIEVRDALLDPYGDTERATESQLEAWKFLHDYLDREFTVDGKKYTMAPLIGMIGAKGSAKTHWGACFALEMAQRYPGSVGCLISNSYQQAKDNGGPLLIKVARACGYEIEFFTGKKIKGRQYTNVYVIRLPGGQESFVLCRSFDAISLIEGVELDWGWAEEVQDSDKDAFVVFVSRIRGSGSPNAIFVAGMPEPGTHWQYKTLPKMGFQEKDKFTGPEIRKLPDGEVSVRVGCLWEPSVFENRKNVGTEYIQRLLEAYSPEDAQRYVYGKRGATRGDRVFYQYRDDIHRRGTMSKMLCHYDPYEKLIISYDFNVYPMSTGLFQPKLWNDAWADLSLINGVWTHDTTGEQFEDVERDFVAPDRIVFAQVDEIEVWPDDPNGGMTRGMVRAIEKKYLNHKEAVVVLGDASGNQRRSSSTTTDWQIIGESMQKFAKPIVKRGLIANSDLKAGVTKYSNPAQRDALMNANRMLMDATGKAWVCFLPESPLQSGGVAAAVTNLGFKADGGFDTRTERKMDRDVPRSHFADIYKYFAWYAKPPAMWNASASRDDRGSSREERIEKRRSDDRRSAWVF